MTYDGKGFPWGSHCDLPVEPQVPSVAFPPKDRPDSPCTTPGAESSPSPEEASHVSEPAEPCTASLVSYLLQLPGLRLTGTDERPNR